MAYMDINMDFQACYFSCTRNKDAFRLLCVS